MADEPTPTEPIEQEDGSLEWPTDPNFTPEDIGEQDLIPVEEDEDTAYPDEDIDDSIEDEGGDDE